MRRGMVVRSAFDLSTLVVNHAYIKAKQTRSVIYTTENFHLLVPTTWTKKKKFIQYFLTCRVFVTRKRTPFNATVRANNQMRNFKNRIQWQQQQPYLWCDASFNVQWYANVLHWENIDFLRSFFWEGLKCPRIVIKCHFSIMTKIGPRICLWGPLCANMTKIF